MSQKESENKCVNIEHIIDTLDPIQKTFHTTHSLLPFWRYCMYLRYVGIYQPQSITCTWTDYTKKHTPCDKHLPVSNILLPSELVQSTLEIRLRDKPSAKLLKIHIYYTTNTILVRDEHA